MLRKSRFIFVVILGLAVSAFGDQITLKNGDHISGKIVKSDGKKLVLHTDFAGDVTIDFPVITQITTDQELHVSTSDKKTAVGPVTVSEGKLEVATKSGPVEIPESNIVLIRNDAEQAAYDKSLHPGLLHGWNGGANVGFSVARGNSETENLALAINAVHPTLNDKTTIYLSSIYTSNQLATPSDVADLIQGGIRYDHNISPRTFLFAAADFMSNELQNLDLRGVYGGGFGYHAVKSDPTTLDFFAGLNYTHETYSDGPQVTPPTVPPTYTSYGETNRFAALTLGEELMHKFGKGTIATETFYFYPDLSDTGQYRTTFTFGTVTKLGKWLGWQNQLGDIYVSNPPVGDKKNDFILTTGLNFTFAQK